MVNLPFSQEEVSENRFIRIFREDLEEGELKWHFDEKDRVVEVLENDGWMFQYDNSLPQLLSGTLEIKAGIWHRVIKGKGTLKLLILEKDI